MGRRVFVRLPDGTTDRILTDETSLIHSPDGGTRLVLGTGGYVDRILGAHHKSDADEKVSIPVKSVERVR